MEKAIKKTKCCNSYSTYHDETLCCKTCWREVEVGEGDGTEYKDGTKKKELTFQLSENKTRDERYQEIEEREEQIQKNLVGIMNAWAKFKIDFQKIENKQKRTDTKVYGVCLGGIFICTILLLIMEWSK